MTTVLKLVKLSALQRANIKTSYIWVVNLGGPLTKGSVVLAKFVYKKNLLFVVKDIKALFKIRKSIVYILKTFKTI